MKQILHFKMRTKNKFSYVLLLAGIFLLSSCSKENSENDSTGSSKTKKLLLIGIDGCRPDALMNSNIPNIKGLLNNSVYSFDALTNSPTNGGNGWSTMLTGASASKHGVSDNTFSSPSFTLYPSFLKRLKTYNPALKAASIARWEPINEHIIDGIDIEKSPKTDQDVKNETVNTIKNDDPDALFVHFDDVDAAGHNDGFSADTPQYKTAIETTDSYIGEILTAIKNRKNYNNEDWLIIISTDHGGINKTHGGSSYQERNIFTIIYNKDFAAQPADPSVTTITGTFVNFNTNKIFASTNNPIYDFGTSSFTIECRIKTSGYSNYPPIVSNKNWATGRNTGFALSLIPNGSWTANIGNNVNRVDASGTNLITDGKWHHLVMVVDRTAKLLKTYQDGAFLRQATIPDDFGSISTGLPLAVGQDGTLKYGSSMNGNIVEVRIWNKALPDDSVLNNMCSAVTSSHPDYTSLIGYWKGDNGSGNIFTDSSPKNVPLSFANAPTWVSVTATLKCKSTGEEQPVPKITDIAYTSLKWFGISAPFGWSLEGRSLLPADQ